MALNPQVKHIQMMKNVRPSMRKDAREDFSVWQKKARERLGMLLGIPAERKTENFRIEWTREEADYTEIRFLFESEEQVDVSCHLLLPATDAEKLPLVICLQGHSTGMHISLGRAVYPGDEDVISGGDRDFARQVIARGQAALTIEQRGFGERGGTSKGPDCQQPAMQALMLGRTLIGERCMDVSGAIDVIAAHFPMIDASRIAIMGNSGGGTTTIYAAAMDERIAAAMPSCAFCGYRESIGELLHCVCNYVPGIANEFDMGDLAGLIAPRPLIVVNGLTDVIFPIQSAKEQMKIAEGLYAQANAENMIRHVVGGEGHRFYAADAWPVFDELTGWKKQ